MTGASYGIEALNVYCGLAAIGVPALFEGRGLDPGRMPNIMMDKRSVGLPFEDTVTNAVNAAKPVIDRLDDGQRERIEILITATESGVDYSKSVASYVHDYLKLSRHCRLVEVKQACYSATAAVQLAVGYTASGVSPGAKVLITASDVTLVDARAGYAEPAMGAGGAAVLVSDEPRVMPVDLGAFGNYSYETMDSARPSPEFDIADVDTSLFAYLDCLSNSVADYFSRVDGADFLTGFDYLAMHTPFCGLVKAGHRKLMREYGAGPEQEIEEDFGRRVLPSLHYPRVVGNLCSGSVYLALASLIDHASMRGGARVGMFAYGSGCSSEFFSGVVDDGSAAALAGFRVRESLDARRELSFEEYALLLKENLRCLVPVRQRSVDLDRYRDFIQEGRLRQQGGLLALSGIENYHREYEWI